ncbi:DUF4247 domain-containing protein [Paenibacillus farraposensis]|uniref:DUF4247 domain-containing protein n=1 Tax=Paenibacillus farraposensis TaxID=2807095 RepID=A0ABW4DED6_9BACL|nr:DUF4247 domain-containing protein [Paenibacillus farraposensis]MCC3381154.1 DUF4247 domain-containing protein [Paenibacillus farraposensis]
MSKRTWQYALKIIVALSLFVSVLSGCGAPNVKDTYPLESVSGSGNSTSYVYRAAGKTVPEVAQELKEQRTPEQMSPQSNERMFLVYSDEWYHLQQDPAKKEDTLIEVDSKKYVEQNYSSSFLKGYLTATVLDALFNSLRGSGSYRGYTSRDVYRPSQGQFHAPTVQEKKAIPPITVERKGVVTRRGKGTGSSVGSGGGLFDRGSSSPSRGSISRDQGSGGSIFGSPRNSYSGPKTRSGRGTISRRSRR